MLSVKDKDIIRSLASEYMQIASLPVQNERRKLWSDHFSLNATRPPVMASFGMHNRWCTGAFGDSVMECENPELRGYERTLKMALFQHEIGDDTILEPWLTVAASTGDGWGGLWGLKSRHIPPDSPDGAWKYDPALAEYTDAEKLEVPHHFVDEADTQRRIGLLSEAVGDIIPININRGPRCLGFAADIITILCFLRGLELVMTDMYENPEWLHGVLAYMRDGVLTNQSEAETAGDLSLACSMNGETPYCDELEWPKANSGPRKLSQLWGFCAAQEMTLVSPAQHDEFVLQYQLPIMKRFGLVHYGCCENLTKKIDMLRQIPNLRSIAVTPSADVAKCAEQIKDDYAISWRPNPTDMVCARFEPDRIRKIVRSTLESTRDCHIHIHLKDVETQCGDNDRLRKWTEIVKSELDNAGY